MSKYDNASLVQIPSGYKAGTLYSVLPANGDGDFDFTRASIATRVNAEGLIESVASGVPRLDYPLLNGVVQSCPALLLEPARTNVFANSQNFTGYAITGATISSDSVISPDGTQNASTLTTSVSGGTFNLTGTIANGNVTFSVFVKKDSVNGVRLRIDADTDSNGYFDLVNNTIHSSDNNAKIENYGNGWYRVSVSANITGFVKANIYTTNGTTSYDNGTLYIWGAQLEAGSYTTSYIPTSGTTVPRAAEVCNGAGTSAEFNDSEGVLFAEISALANDGTNRVLGISDDSASDRVIIYFSSTSNQIASFISSSGISQATLTYSLTDVTSLNKIAVKYKLNDIGFWVNGFEVGTDTLATMPIGLLDLSFDNGTGTEPFYGKTKQLIAFDAALTDEELEDLTSWDSFEEMAASQLYTIY